MKRLGVALGGGGLKCLAHIGVLQVLLESGIEPACIAGTSGGSIVGALYACGVSPYEMERMVYDLSPTDYLDYDFVGMIKHLFSLLMPVYKYELNGLIKGEKIEQLIHQLTRGKKIRETKIPLAIISCDIDSGRQVMFCSHNRLLVGEEIVLVREAVVSEAVRASISIPVTFQSRWFKGMQMVDGGLKDIVPVMAVKAMATDYILAVDLGREIYPTRVSGLMQIISRTLSILTFETSVTEEKMFANMVLFPKVYDLKLDQIKEAPKIIREGRREMKKHINLLKKELQLHSE